MLIYNSQKLPAWVDGLDTATDKDHNPAIASVKSPNATSRINKTNMLLALSQQTKPQLRTLCGV